MAVQSNPARPLTISDNKPFPEPGKSPTTSGTQLSSTYYTNLGHSNRQSKNKKQYSANTASIDSNTTSRRPIDHFTDQPTCAESWAPSSQNEHITSVTPSRDSMSVSLTQYRSHPSRTNLLLYMLFLVTFLTVFHLAGANIRLAPKYHRHQNRESLTIPSFHPKVHCSIYVDQITENVKYFNADVRQPYYRRFPINSYHSAISSKGSEYKTTIELHPEAFCYLNTFDCIICTIIHFNTLIACFILQLFITMYLSVHEYA